MRTQASGEFEKLMRSLLSRYQTWQVFSDFVMLCQIAISNSIPNANQIEKRESMYAHIIEKYNHEEASVFPKLLGCVVDALERNMFQDYLGDLYMRLELGSHWHGQFFTPFHLCEAMARITIESDGVRNALTNRGWISVHDPACGAGATLIAAAHVASDVYPEYNWQEHFLFIAQDIDPVTAGMCYIQLSLIGAAGYVKIGDTLSDPITGNDPKQDEYWYTPMYFSKVWAERRLWNFMNSLISTSNKRQVETTYQANAKELPHVASKDQTKHAVYTQISMF